MRLFIAWIKKKLGIQSPSAYINGYRYEYDYLKSQYRVKVITRGRCMLCGKELTEGLFFCKECEAKVESEDKE